MLAGTDNGISLLIEVLLLIRSIILPNGIAACCGVTALPKDLILSFLSMKPECNPLDTPSLFLQIVGSAL